MGRGNFVNPHPNSIKNIPLVRSCHGNVADINFNVRVLRMVMLVGRGGCTIIGMSEGMPGRTSKGEGTRGMVGGMIRPQLMMMWMVLDVCGSIYV